MPSFDVKFPDAAVHFEAPREDDVFKADHPAPCLVCKQLTHWVSFTWLLEICSTECDHVMLDDYASAEHAARQRDEEDARLKKLAAKPEVE